MNCAIHPLNNWDQASDVQRLDSYPVDKYHQNLLSYPVDSDIHPLNN